MFEVFVCIITPKKSYFFPILGGGAPGAPPSPWIRPWFAPVKCSHLVGLLGHIFPLGAFGPVKCSHEVRSHGQIYPLHAFTHSLSRVVVPATLDSISVNAHLKRELI